MPDWYRWVAGLWLAWFVYWMLSAIGGKRVRRRESVGSHLIHMLPMAVAATLMIVPQAQHFLGLGIRFLPASAGLRWLGVVLVAAGLAYTVWARLALGSNWSISVMVKEGHELVRSGPYRHVRHPIYSGLLLATLGTAIAFGQWRGLVALALMAVAVLPKVRLEEAWMTEEFGDAYRRYREESAALVPGVW